jgi:hypothetical protein
MASVARYRDVKADVRAGQTGATVEANRKRLIALVDIYDRIACADTVHFAM